VVAESKTGVVTESALAIWRAHSPQTSRLDRTPTSVQEVQSIVVRRTLANCIESMPAEASDACRDRVMLRATEVKAHTLKNSISKACEPSPEATLKEYEATIDRYRRPKRWRLFNIFLRVPGNATADEHTDLRDRATELRRRAMAGEDFSQLARRESDSPTAIRGGRIGNVTPGSFPPAIASIITKLTAGDTSGVIDTADGFTILRCTEILPAETLDLDKVRPLVTGNLKRTCFDPEWAATDAAIQKRVSTKEQGETIAVFVGEISTSISPAAFTWWARRLGPWKPEIWDRAERAETLNELAMTFGRAYEAAERELIATPEIRDKLDWETERIAAECALEYEIDQRFVSPTDDEVETYYDAHKDDLKDPERRSLELLRVPLSPKLPSEIYRRLAEIAKQVADEELSLEEAAGSLAAAGIGAHVENRPNLPPRGIQTLGRSIGTAAAELGAGAVGEVVQEGRDLVVIRCTAVTPERRLNPDEAEPLILRRLSAQKRRQLRAEIEADIVAEQKIRMIGNDKEF